MNSSVRTSVVVAMLSAPLCESIVARSCRCERLVRRGRPPQRHSRARQFLSGFAEVNFGNRGFKTNAVNLGRPMFMGGDRVLDESHSRWSARRFNTAQ